jgi:hypothetical protein
VTFTRTLRSAALALCAVLASCATPQEATHDADTADSPATELSLPLQRYVATDAERAMVDRAYVVLLNRCTSSHGYPERAVTPEDPPKSTPVAWRYGLNDHAVAARYGYHVPPEYRRNGEAERAEAERRYAENPMPDSESQVHLRCVDEVQRQLGKPEGGGGHMDDVLAQSLGVEGFAASMADARVRAATQEWANCLRGMGHEATDPLAVTAGFDLTTERPSPAEVEMATEDVACKQRSDLTRIWHTVEVEQQNSLVQANLDQLEAGRRSVDTALRVAAETLGKAAPR